MFMIVPTILSLLLGAALGFRFKVFVLIPAVGFTVVSVVLANIAYSYSLTTLAITMATTVTALQIGYLLGSIRPATREDRSRRIDEALASAPPDTGLSVVD